MATVTGLTAERMIEMENATVVDGNVVGNDLILVTRDSTEINAGNVRGPQGPSGGGFTICTSSTRPSWGSGDEGKAIYETDTDLVRMWTGTRWRLQEKIICTSTTRPTVTADDEGVTIYETDSNSEFIWNGTAWVSPFNALMPVGSEMLWAGQLSTVPPLFMHEDGRVLSREAYASLFAVLGVTWNTGGELGTQFRIPDSRARVAVGAGNTYGVGTYGGENSHTLNINEMPAHHHGPSGIVNNAGANNGGVAFSAAGTAAYTDYTGGGAAHNNMQAFAAKYVIMRVL